MKHLSIYFVLLFIFNGISYSQQFVLLTPAQHPPLKDIMSDKNLIKSAENTLEYFKAIRLNKADQQITYNIGNRSVTAVDIENSVAAFLDIYKNSANSSVFEKSIKEKFDIYNFTGNTQKEKVFFTCYYEPTYNVSTVKQGKYIYPMYSTPKDLIILEKKNFENDFTTGSVECTLAKNQLYPYTGGEKITVNTLDFTDKWTGGRITGRIENNKLVPYYTRQEIDIDKILEKKDLAEPIAWFKSAVELMDVHIQGTGILVFENQTKFRASFTYTSSLPFRGYVRSVCAEKKLPVTKAAADDYLETHESECLQLLAVNPRYVFFQLVEVLNDEHRPGETKRPLLPFRSIAVDTKYIPLGSLVYVRAKGVTTNEKNKKAETNVNGFVFGQDIGGAIKGLHIDYFVGSNLNTTVYDKNGYVYLFLLKRK